MNRVEKANPAWGGKSAGSIQRSRSGKPQEARKHAGSSRGSVALSKTREAIPETLTPLNPQRLGERERPCSADVLRSVSPVLRPCLSAIPVLAAPPAFQDRGARQRLASPQSVLPGPFERIHQTWPSWRERRSRLSRCLHRDEASKRGLRSPSLVRH